MSPAPQENSISATHQDPNAVVMDAKGKLKNYLKTAGIEPKVLARLGKMAEQSIKDKALYPMVKDAAVKAKLMPQGGQEGIDYKLIATLVSGGKLAEMIMKEGFV